MTEFLQDWILTLLIVAPVVGAVAVGLLNSQGSETAAAARIRRLALGFSVATLALALIAVVLFLNARDNAGNSSAASRPITAITTSSSTSVKAVFCSEHPTIVDSSLDIG